MNDEAFQAIVLDQLANIRISVELLRKEFSEVKSQTEYLANNGRKISLRRTDDHLL